MKDIQLESENARVGIATINGKHHLWLNIPGAITGQLIEISQRTALEIEKYIMLHGTENNQNNTELRDGL